MWFIAYTVVTFLVANEALRRLDLFDKTKERNIVLLTIIVLSFCVYVIIDWLTVSVPIASIAGVISAIFCAWILVARYPNRLLKDDSPTS